VTDVEQDTEPAPTAAAAEPQGRAGRRRGGIVPVVVAAVVGAVVAAVVAAVVVTRLPAGGSGSDAAPEQPAAGEIVPIDPMTLNLADGHYAKVGLAIELVEGVKADDFVAAGEPAKAEDLVISTLSTRTSADLSTPQGRDAVKAALRTGAKRLYPDEYHDVYLTDLVIQ
jgi:flagellar FliL protein